MTIPAPPPNSWSSLAPDATQAEIDDCDAAHDAWLASQEGLTYLAWDKAVVERANALNISYHEAMEMIVAMANQPNITKSAT